VRTTVPFSSREIGVSLLFTTCNSGPTVSSMTWPKGKDPTISSSQLSLAKKKKKRKTEIHIGWQ
jgi:hypothetical protein